MMELSLEEVCDINTLTHKTESCAKALVECMANLAVKSTEGGLEDVSSVCDEVDQSMTESEANKSNKENYDQYQN